MAPFDPSLRSLPTDIWDTPFAGEVGSDEARALLEGVKEGVLFPPDEKLELEIVGRMPRPYPTARRGRPSVREFYSRPRVAKSDLVVGRPEGECYGILRAEAGGVEDGDTRAMNKRAIPSAAGNPDVHTGRVGEDRVGLGRRFGPPGLATEVEISAGTIDVKDCFYRVRVRRSLPEYFALPPIRADSVVRRLATGWTWPCRIVCWP